MVCLEVFIETSQDSHTIIFSFNFDNKNTKKVFHSYSPMIVNHDVQTGSNNVLIIVSDQNTLIHDPDRKYVKL